jgi:hypothetical protein
MSGRAVQASGRSLLATVLLAAVRAYRLVPKVGPPRCRFHPTCSEYALEAIDRHGALAGTVLAVRRIGRCHPFHPGGVDHVPQHPVRRAE